MSEICAVCGLPKELCVCAAIAKEKVQIRIRAVRRRFGKLTTVISGIEAKGPELKKLAKQLKERLACGGTVKNFEIELQGDHRTKVKEVLSALGFEASGILVEQRIE